MLKELPLVGIGGEYRLQLSKNNDNPHVDTGFFKNLITNNGLNSICNISPTAPSSNNYNFFTGVEAPLQYCFVGSGSSPPAENDVQLQNRVGNSNSSQESVVGTSSFSRGYAEIVIVYRFSVGSVLGNLSEVGIGASPTSLFSRALILDANGDPTTITVLTDDILTVTYRLRLNIPQSDIFQNINVNSSGVDTPTVVTIRPFASETYPVTSALQSFAWGVKRGFGYVVNSVATSSAEELMQTSATAVPGSVAATSISINNYEPNSYKRTGVATFSTTQSNRTIHVFCYSFGPGCFQVKFDPPLQKTNQLALRLSFGFQVARA